MIGRLAGFDRHASRQRAGELLERFGLAGRRGAPRRHVLRRHAPPARSGREHRLRA